MTSPYATTSRPEVHDVIPADALKFLDVGCNDGGFGSWLKNENPLREIYGVEPNESQASIAEESHIKVVREFYPGALAQLPSDFDCVTFNHVLEHMVDPWDALEKTKSSLKEGGIIVAILPNVRFISVILSLVIRGNWKYVESGILDKTHLRFFTKSSIVELFESCKFEIIEIKAVNGIGEVRFPFISKIAGLIFRGFWFGGYRVLACTKE